jgi:hypothetical protein
MVADIDVDVAHSWLRLSCPACGAWLGVPGDVERGRRGERVARRMDAFVYRHAHARNWRRA